MTVVEVLMGLGLLAWTGAVGYLGYRAGRFVQRQAQ